MSMCACGMGSNSGASGLSSEVVSGGGLDPIVAGTCAPIGEGSGRGILNPSRVGREADVGREFEGVRASPRVRPDRSEVGAMPRPSLSTA